MIMKKLSFLLAATAIILGQQALSQNITLTFTGVSNSGNYVRLDSVKIRNNTRFWEETVIYPDSTFVIPQVGIAAATDGAAVVVSHPNPYYGNTHVSVYVHENIDATLQLFTLSGQKVSERTATLQAGDNLFEIRTGAAQVYLFTVTTPQGRTTLKLLNRGNNRETSILNTGSTILTDKRQCSNVFQIGDVLKATGYTTFSGIVIASRNILRTPTESEQFALSFDMPTMPALTTTAASGVTSTSATLGGNVTTDGGMVVTARGVCWNTIGNATIRDAHISNGDGTGVFVSNLYSLTPSTTYYARAYATNAVGTAYGNEVSFSTSASLPTVGTSAMSNVTDSTAVSGGTVTRDGGSPVTSRGVCWDTAAFPTINGSHTTDSSGVGSFTSSITGLTANTTYHVRAYATNAVGTAYGNEVTFSTSSLRPSVSTTAASHITTTTATAGGTVSSDGGSPVTSRGVCWDTAAYPTINGNHTSDSSGVGSFTSIITGLTANTTYHVRAYATNAVGTAYGNEVTFTTTAAIPSVSTASAANISSYSAILGGTVSGDGGSSVTSRGVCWDTAAYPTINGNHTSDSSGVGSFTSIITGLTANTTYHVRAYATNAVGTAYGNEVTFTTTAAIPSVSTASATNISSYSASLGGNVLSDGGSPVTMRGIYINTNGTPTLSDVCTNNGSGNGQFTANLTNLTPGTAYYVRAYATNAIGTAYGSQITFTTPVTIPTVVTQTASNITDTSATAGGAVANDGGSPVTARGVCWSTSINPTINGSHTSDSSGIGIFVSNIVGLSSSTTYHLRAYATNAAGTAYGSDITFTTSMAPAPQGALSGIFSVSSNNRVRFSQGNLQWSATNGTNIATSHSTATGSAAGTWRFATNQWDTIGSSNGSLSDSYSGWIDLFGWGTSSYNNKHPYMRSTNSAEYGNGNADIAGTYYDWGAFNAISNGGNQPGIWRILTWSEWDYLLNRRSTTSGIRYAKATVNGVPGLVILPDNWSTSIASLDSTNTNAATFSSNIINVLRWTTLENYGCVFLPATGYRNGTSVIQLGAYGYYWSGSVYDSTHSYSISIYNNNVQAMATTMHFGMSVRLVQTVR